MTDTPASPISISLDGFSKGYNDPELAGALSFMIEQHGLLQLDAPAAGVARLYAQFAADLRDGTADAPDITVALERHRVLDAITRAAETGQRQ